MTRPSRCAWLLAGLLASLASPAMALSDAELRGKQIYLYGTSSRDTTINAVVGEEGSTIPASAIPCANCHGYDGLGRPEGGVIPTDVRWSQLSKTYGHVHEDGRRHPAFDEESLIRSIILGMDPADNRLDRSMPLYLLSGEDAADLVAYLKVLEKDLDPGIEEGRIRVATLLPQSGRAAALGEVMEGVLRGHFADVNAQGGIFGRQIELVTVPLGATPDESLANLRRTLETQGVLALVGGYTVGLDDALLDMLRIDNVPLVGPFTLDPGDVLLDAAAFYLYPGFEDQVRVLANQALSQVNDPERVMIAKPASGQHDDLANVARRQLGATIAPIDYVSGGDASALAESARTRGSEAVLFFGAQSDLDSLMVELAVRDLSPRIYVLSSFLSRPLFDAPMSLSGNIVVAYPTLASDISTQGQRDYREFAQRHELPSGHIQAQVATYAAARVFVEGLRRAGRDLARSRLVEGIEALYNFRTGFTPPLTYGPNRRIGALGAHLMAVDIDNRTMVPVGDGWQELR